MALSQRHHREVSSFVRGSVSPPLAPSSPYVPHALPSFDGAPRSSCAAASARPRGRWRMKPARPLGEGRTDPPALRLVAGAEVSAIELLQQAETAEHRGRSELARSLYERV